MGHQSSLSNSPGSTRIQFEAARTAAGVGGGLLWLGFFRGVRVVCCWWWRFRPFLGFPGALAGLSGL